MELLPYDEKGENGFYIRTFKRSTPSEEFKWHFDDENRIVVPIKSNGWKIQIDESLPVELVVGKQYFVPVDVYHRVIKGNGDLKVKLYKLDSIKREIPEHKRNYREESIISDNLIYHLDNGIKLNENVFRYGSDAWCDLIQEAKELFEKGIIQLDKSEMRFLDDDPGKIIYHDGKKVILNTPMRNHDKNGFDFFVDVLNKNNKVERVFFS